MTRLERLRPGFESPKSRPVWETRLLSPLFIISEYLEDVVARVDAPLLDRLFYIVLIFDTPQLSQFFARTLNIQSLVGARIVFSDSHVVVTSPQTFPRSFELGVSCRQSDWQLSSLAQVCSSSFPQVLIRMVEHLHISETEYDPQRWQDDIEGSQWLEALRQFTALKDLHVSREFLPRIAPAFQGNGGTRDRSVACLAESFLGGTPPDRSVRTYPRSPGEVRRRPVPCRSPYHCLPLEQKTRQVIGVGG